MDKIDMKLVKMLQENARMPLKHLAEGVFLSSPATASRIEKLEKDGIITGYGAKIDHKKLGFPITAFINLEIHPSQKPVFYPFIQQHPNVIECDCVTGHYSMMIKVAFESTENLDTFIGQLQTNKVKYLMGKVSCIQSVGSVKLAKEISRLCQHRNQNRVFHREGKLQCGPGRDRKQ